MKKITRQILESKMAKHHFKTFDKNTKSSFGYWYYHWKAFNLVAWYLGVWSLPCLLHDAEKPWLKLFWSYKKVQAWHRKHNSHHMEYKGGLQKIKWEYMVVDNECSRFTKEEAQLNSREWFDYCVCNGRKNVSAMETYYLPTLIKLGL